MDTFEYKTIMFNSDQDDLDKDLEFLGSKGWELVSANKHLGSQIAMLLIFKKKKSLKLKK